MRLFRKLFNKSEPNIKNHATSASRNIKEIKYLLIFTNRNLDGSDSEIGPKRDALISKIFTLIEGASNKCDKVSVVVRPDIGPDASEIALGMSVLMQGPLVGTPLNPEKTKYYPYTFAEAKGVAAVQYK